MYCIGSIKCNAGFYSINVIEDSILRTQVSKQKITGIVICNALDREFSGFKSTSERTCSGVNNMNGLCVTNKEFSIKHGNRSCSTVRNVEIFSKECSPLLNGFSFLQAG